MMRFHLPRPLLQLITAILLAPSPAVRADPHPALSALAGFEWKDLFARYDCSGELCGYSSQLCCSAGSTCYTDQNNEAQCATATEAATAEAGYWTTYTSIFTETDTVLTTQLMSSYIGTYATATAEVYTTASCAYAVNEVPCGSICCASNQYCFSPADSQCSAIANGGSSGYESTYTTPEATVVATANPGIRGTSSSLVLVTQTASPTATVPFESPVATGANITLTSDHVHNNGLSGGAIAGIVIGVLLGLALLALILFCCCVRGIWVGLCGGGRRKRRTTEVEEYERYSHHGRGSGGGGRTGGGRTWYGAAKPARSSRYEEREKRDNKGTELLGLGAGLAALWALLGLKRQRDNRRRQDEKTEYSYSSDYYTSASEYSTQH